ncbi:pyridoxal phosphate-dependent decarboxylase family protein [Streptomyces sp. URMC 123]|uniref:pyridoxal phosphate-dependent decarboxylase family protein n=1 Tax=Streptomyces sp. URMC 123 TaxID=3423403 RepID=UPI003F1DEB99
MTLPGSAISGQAAPPAPVPPLLLEPDLLAADPAGLADVARLVAELTREAAAGLRRRSGPLPAMSPQELTRLVDSRLPDGVIPRTGGGRDALLALARHYAEGTVDLADPRAAAHLQPPPLTVAVAADTLANVFNASCDTWDSGPYAVEIERRLVRGLTELAGFGPEAGGVLTPGGTASNLQALLIARDAVLRDRRGADVRGGGLLGLGARPVVFCSELAHFSVARACAVIGLGEDAVRPVPADADHRMRPDALEAVLRALGPDEVPLAVVATAGTTDFGSIDPIAELAALAHEHGARLHVDAAYGGGALFSDRLRPLLAGIELADTVTLDLHKTAWQPAAASALLARNAADFAPTALRVAYLNPDDDGAAGLDGLLGLSLQTTRRADALKVAATFLALGREGVGAMLEACHDLARYAQRAIDAHPRLELTAGATLTTVVFRYRTRDKAASDAVNGALRRALLGSGRALIGRTDAADEDGRQAVHLKFTLLNPQARTSDIDELLAAVVRAGEDVEMEEEFRDA